MLTIGTHGTTGRDRRGFHNSVEARNSDSSDGYATATLLGAFFDNMKPKGWEVRHSCRAQDDWLHLKVAPQNNGPKLPRHFVSRSNWLKSEALAEESESSEFVFFVLQWLYLFQTALESSAGNARGNPLECPR